MRVAIKVVAAIALVATGVVLPTRAARGQIKRAQPTYDLYFPNVSVPPDAGISLVRVVISCGHVAAVNRLSCLSQQFVSRHRNPLKSPLLVSKLVAAGSPNPTPANVWLFDREAEW